MSEILDAALAHAEAGFRIFPTHHPIDAGTSAVRCSCGSKGGCNLGKHPAVKEWQTVATTDQAQIKKWWTDQPSSNVGVLTGSANKITVIDVDPLNGGDTTWARLLRNNEPLPITMIVDTGSDGNHWYFAEVEGVGSAAHVLGDGVDIRGDGGYVIGAGSLHASGKRYSTSLVGGDVGIQPAPDWLIKLMREGVPRDGKGKGRGKRNKWGRTTAEQLQWLLGTIGDGQDRDGALISLAGMLWRDGIAEDRLRPLLEQYAAAHLGLPAKTGGDFTRIVKSARKYERDPQAHIEVEDVDEYLRRKLETAEKVEGVILDDFWAHMPSHSYIYTPTRAHWPASSVNARLPPVELADEHGKPILDAKGNEKRVAAATWLDAHRSVEQMTWAPGLPMIIPDRLIVEGGWIDRRGVKCFNLYLPPTIELGDAGEAGKWVEHVHYVYPADADHIINWLAHRVQRPGDKVNHALVLGGAPGIGKDTLLAPARAAVGPWNCQEVSPKHVLDDKFNGFVKSVILRVSEAHDLGEYDRFALHDRLKAYTAAPPEVLRCNEKHLREHAVLNCCGVVITTNHKTDGVFLSPDDRRHYVTWSERTNEDDRFQGDYWDELWGYYREGGYGHIAAFLMERDISGFDAKAPPPKTSAFWAIGDANRAPEEAELADLLDALGSPPAVTLESLLSVAKGDADAWLRDRKNRRAIPHRLERCGYVPVRNLDAKDGLWKLDGRRVAVYAKASLSLKNQHLAVRWVERGARMSEASCEDQGLIDLDRRVGNG
jgi:Bifunctional DNA primase/polymerase, N-terminal